MKLSVAADRIAGIEDSTLRPVHYSEDMSSCEFHQMANSLTAELPNGMTTPYL